MARMEKVSITLDAEVVAAIRDNVGKREFSAYVNETLKQQLQLDSWIEWLEELDRELGPIPEDVQQRVSNELSWP